MLSAFKNFGVTFLISALLFGVVAYFATGLVTNTVGEMLDDENTELNEIIQNEEASQTDESENTQQTNTNVKVPVGESFNFLVVVTDARPDYYTDYQPDVNYMYNTDWYSISPDETIGCLSADYRKVNLASIVLVRIDKDKREFNYTYFSPKTRVYTSTGYHTFSEVYNLYGIDRISEYVYSMTGLDIKYNFVINGYDLDELYTLLGGVTVNLGKDIYSDGTYNTMQYETTVDHIEADGSEWTEHKPNTFLVGKGDTALTEDNIYTIISAQENSASDYTAKEAYIIEILQKYLTYLASLEEKQLKITLAQLITDESEWKNIDGLVLPEETEPAETDTPWNGGEEQVEEADEEFDVSSRWIREAYEPDGPILRTNYTMNDFDGIYELLCAITYFENKTITYPCEYYAATEESGDYFDADVNSGIELFMDYRK